VGNGGRRGRFAFLLCLLARGNERSQRFVVLGGLSVWFVGLVLVVCSICGYLLGWVEVGVGRCRFLVYG